MGVIEKWRTVQASRILDPNESNNATETAYTDAEKKTHGIVSAISDYTGITLSADDDQTLAEANVQLRQANEVVIRVRTGGADISLSSSTDSENLPGLASLGLTSGTLVTFVKVDNDVGNSLDPDDGFFVNFTGNEGPFRAKGLDAGVRTPIDSTTEYKTFRVQRESHVDSSSSSNELVLYEF